MSFTAFPDPDSGDQVLGRSIAEWDEMINSERGFLALTSLSVDSDAACQLLPLLHRALLEGDADMRLSVLTTLASVGEPARRVVPAILDVVRSGTLDLRVAALEAVVKIGCDEQHRAELQTLIDLLLEAESQRVVLPATVLHWRTTGDTEAARPVITQALRSSDPELQEIACAAAGELGDAAFADDVLTLARTGGCGVQIAAGEALPRLKPITRRVIDALLDSLSDPNTHDALDGRTELNDALAGLSAGTDPLSLLDDLDEPFDLSSVPEDIWRNETVTNCDTTFVLTQIVMEQPEVLAWLMSRLDDDRAVVRHAAAELVISSLFWCTATRPGWEAPQTVEVSAETIESLRELLQNAETLDRMSGLAISTDANVRVVAAACLWAVEPGERWRDALLEGLAGPEDLALGAVHACGCGDHLVRARLHELLGNSGLQTSVMAGQSLWSSERCSETLVPRLIELIQEHGGLATLPVCALLGQIGEAARDAIPALLDVREQCDLMTDHLDDLIRSIDPDVELPESTSLAERLLNPQMDSDWDPKDRDPWEALEGAPFGEGSKSLFRGILAEKEDNPQRALQHYTAALEFDNTHVDAVTSRAMLYVELGETGKAIDDLQQVLQEHPENIELRLQLAVSLREAERYPESMAEYDRVEQLDPNEHRVWFLRGIALRFAGCMGDAVRAYERAIERQTDNTLALNNLADLLASCADASFHDGPRAVELARQACVQDEWTTPILVETLAQAYARNRDFERAVETQEEALALHRQDADCGLDDRTQAEEKLSLYKSGRAWSDDC
jgi:tetratricopeptide (TPR) repeat protein